MMVTQIHGAEAARAVDDFDAAQSFELESAFLFGVHLLSEEVADVIVSNKQKAAGASGGVHDAHAGSGEHDIDDGLNERAWREILASAGLNVFGVLLQKAFVYIALDVSGEIGPRFAADEFGD